eukprot:TRINITY_DN16169_c0_g1_i1.p1 TRINITY_DN16169_c0_g1~~TRINITY_DN16169_c0_g1_i1.p1  ORF type:complete len:297 (+),score=32.72 TRINITY_DN16169_c0_g1_i1:22-891(+)
MAEPLAKRPRFTLQQARETWGLTVAKLLELPSGHPDVPRYEGYRDDMKRLVSMLETTRSLKASSLSSATMATYGWTHHFVAANTTQPSSAEHAAMRWLAVAEDHEENQTEVKNYLSQWPGLAFGNYQLSHLRWELEHGGSTAVVNGRGEYMLGKIPLEVKKPTHANAWGYTNLSPAAIYQAVFETQGTVDFAVVSDLDTRAFLLKIDHDHKLVEVERWQHITALWEHLVISGLHLRASGEKQPDVDREDPLDDIPDEDGVLGQLRLLQEFNRQGLLPGLKYHDPTICVC